MLNSQITPSARNIPTYAATRIRTREPRQTMTEDALIAGWPDDAKAYRERAAQTHPHTGRKMGSREAGAGINEQVLAILSDTEWTSVTEVRDQLGFDYNKARNALDRLVTKHEVVRRIVDSASGMSKRTLYRLNARAADRRKRDAAMLVFMAEPRGVVELAEFAGLSPQRVSAMLGEWKDQGKVTKEWTPGAKGRGTHLWRATTGSEGKA